ncbi:hypothetical protein Tco_1357111 [Tanacetum coccineum]
MASMNTRLNIKKLDGNIVQKHGSSKQVGFKQLGPGVEIGFHGVQDKKNVFGLRWNCRDREAIINEWGHACVFFESIFCDSIQGRLKGVRGFLGILSLGGS